MVAYLLKPLEECDERDDPEDLSSEEEPVNAAGGGVDVDGLVAVEDGDDEFNVVGAEVKTVGFQLFVEINNGES